MNAIVLLCLIFYIFVRVIGLGVSIDFYYDTKNKKFIIFILCWTFWILANLMPIFSIIIEITSLVQLFLVLNIVLFLIGSYFYLWGFCLYFMSISYKYMLSLISISIIIAFLFYLIIDYNISILFSSITIFVLSVSGFIIPPLKKKHFRKYIGKSIRWYYITLSTLLIYIPTLFVIYFQGYSYGLYDAENSILIMLNYVPTIISAVLLIILLVHLEYTTSSRDKSELKDKYSHNLGNIMQVIMSSSDLIKNVTNLDVSQKEKLKLIEEKCKEAAKLIKGIRKI